MKTTSTKKPAAKKTTTPKTPNPGEVLQSAITEAAYLAGQIDEMSKRLDFLKSSIRESALALMGPQQNSFEIDTELGKCRVVKVKAKLTLVKSADPDVLKFTLSEELWNTFFVFEPKLRPTAEAAFLSMNEAQRAALGEQCPFVMVPQSAQVRLPK